MATIDAGAKTGRMLIYRHSLVVRLSHWVNVLCLTVLLFSGLQIFNAHPALYWGQYGADNDPSFIAMEAVEDGARVKGLTHIGSFTFNTTGFLGLSTAEGEATARGFPSWLTLPSYQDLSSGRRWHFFFAWLFVVNGLAYLAYGLISRHFRRDLAPARSELALTHLGQEVVNHARLRFPKGPEARHYNTLQKLTYLVVIFLLLPLMIATGLTMSPGFNAVAPWLLDVFGGRQSARTLHFLTAFSLVAFVIVHIVMVVLSGVFNNLRSMITGYYAIEQGEK
ncbi:UNVERIFIED_ORG: thiosulfate reductase cytochrome b subunit [Rhizobium esperanzae]|uniref:Cytochrome b/b6 domain-containing protein n=1 Tax=Rhizobium phaseoli TaxID=396 RepID=A0A192TLF5_9HYPH|nr:MULTISPECIES: cytochrome b/b6 domain-containing protein [Rhizobium]KEC69443.1 transmembrane cytochrome b-type protein [Rhizobium leguminosarum bv. phaseoli CCGM1]MDH6645594.1 thiosulfate reductase cytochrome b subunit [Rhizobium esperanzae]ANL50176.1 cytochrome b/b6/petB protein [Rhizobium phaseoli]ANL88297.1 cytochrome b/b6/petB protein [Rhizobium phaseoli]ANL94806.1 cytochrome b/b6/petB protein [Rhizobium phaseoli]